MNCTQCQQPLKDGALYCEHCGHQFAVEEQRRKVNAARAKTRSILAAQFHSGLFLALTICFTVAFATQTGGLLSFIFMLIAMIGMWKCYAAKTADNLQGSSIRLVSIFDSYNNVIHTIYIVIATVITSFAVWTGLKRNIPPILVVGD